jgi:hypothetical protein
MEPGAIPPLAPAWIAAAVAVVGFMVADGNVDWTELRDL